MNVVGWSGRLRASGEKLFSASRVGLGKSRLFTHLKVNASRGLAILRLMRLRLWMMKGSWFCRVSGLADIMIAAIRNMLSVMRKGK